MILSAIFDQLGTFHWHPRSSSWSTFPGEVEEFQNVAAQSKEIRAVTLARTAHINRNGSFDQLPSLRPIPRARVVSPLQAWCLVSCGIRESANLLLERFSRPRR
jgi:hypothetical protein